ncbi:MAG: RnfABCDGE type electron transport complex subunit C, partial [Muribaculaceae bacterium]|nr:RnfABCDGE type electron transport complex subunit C [Muribaculaceae bacterium]
MRLSRFKRGGVHPADSKRYTCDVPVTQIAAPPTLTLMLRQNIGAPSRAVVKAGMHVSRGDLVAEAGGFVGAPVHSPVSGVVKGIERVRDLSGYWAEAIIIVCDEEAGIQSEFYADVTDEMFADACLSLTSEEIIQRISSAGVVGLGGASFPTHVKLSVPEGKRVDTLVLNGAECEPYLTCDDRLMRERPEDVIRGALLLSLACRAQRIVIGVEANKPEAIRRLGEAKYEFEEICRRLERRIEIIPLRTRYPQGSEKQLIQAVTGRIVPVGGLPL